MIFIQCVILSIISVALSDTTAAVNDCVDVTVVMSDSFGDGWNGNYLHLSSEVHLTMSNGFAESITVCLPVGEYSPFCCGGQWDYEVGWSITIRGEIVLSGGAGFECAVQGKFWVLPENCRAATKKIGNGVCNTGNANTHHCGYDGGDCCESTCLQHPDPAVSSQCGRKGYDCQDPNIVGVTCTAKADKLGNGVCNKGKANTHQCGYDAGDCCEVTCLANIDNTVRTRCGSKGYDCKDPMTD